MAAGTKSTAQKPPKMQKKASTKSACGKEAASFSNRSTEKADARRSTPIFPTRVFIAARVTATGSFDE